MALEYKKVGTETRYREETNTIEQDIGFEDIPVCRPSFFFFDFTGLKPSSPHWFFLDGEDVTKYINTSFTLDSLNNASRQSLLRDPGDAYVSETQFPAAQGGPTNGGSGPVNTDSAGNLSGAFYLQSNSTTSFVVGTKVLSVIDVSSNNKLAALSYSQTEFEALGLYDLYYETTTSNTVAYEADIYDWVEVPDPVPPASSGSSNDNNNGGAVFYSHYEPQAGLNFWEEGYFT